MQWLKGHQSATLKRSPIVSGRLLASVCLILVPEPIFCLYHALPVFPSCSGLLTLEHVLCFLPVVIALYVVMGVWRNPGQVLLTSFR